MPDIDLDLPYLARYVDYPLGNLQFWLLLLLNCNTLLMRFECFHIIPHEASLVLRPYPNILNLGDSYSN